MAEGQLDAFQWWDLAPRLLDRVAVQRLAGAPEPPADLAILTERANAAADEAIDRFQALVADGEDPFGQVCVAAGLDDVDAAVLAVLATCELDPVVLRQATADVTRATSRVSVGLLVALFGADGVRAVAAGGRLDQCGLVEVESAVALVAASVAVPRSVLWRLLDEPFDHRELHPAVEVVRCHPAAADGAERVLVHGADALRRTQAAALATLGLLLYAGPAPADDDGWRSLTRRATLDGAGLAIELSETTPSLRRWIETCDHLSWALCSADPIDIGSLPLVPWVDVDAQAPPATDEEWAATFGDEPRPPRMPTVSQLRLASVVGSAAGATEAVRRVATGALLKHATRIRPRVGWDELILPDAQMRRLHDLIDRYRMRSVVHDDWGLPLYPSPGVVTLFSGPSGTGKTTTAEVLAHELGVDMFRVDLSALVSKYIGETEKNLEEIFSAAHAGDYLLLFDEADSLFGTRSKVSDARDRYANMEVSYLLQRLETYDGFVVLTSNFQGNIDPAFLRRIHVTVHFAVPSVEDRSRIWRRSLGQAPQDELDLDFVADRFDLTGGSIRNAALTAAFYAAGGRRAVTMVDVLRAVSQEMIKLGRRPNDDQFGRWLGDLKD